MSKIQKTSEQNQEFNISASAYLKKAGVIDQMAQVIPDAKKSKLDIALMEILTKQFAKLEREKAKKIIRLEIKFASVEESTKCLIIAERANPRMGVPRDIYNYTEENKIKLLDAIDALELEQVDVHTRSVAFEDMPELTDEEKEAFADYIIVEPKKAE